VYLPVCTINTTLWRVGGLEQRSRYECSLWAGCYKVWTPHEATNFLFFWLALGSTKPHLQWV